MPTKLTSDRVHELFLDCLFRDEELAGGMPYTRVIKGEGITKTAGFCAERLEGHKAEIAELCEELPPEFKDGWSFLNMCNTKDGELWTGEHRTMEELVMFEIDLKADADSHVELSYRKLKQLSECLGTDLIHVKTQFGYDISEVTPGPCDSCKLEIIVE